MQNDVHRGGLGYFASVDGLRAIAVVSVMLFHLEATLLPGGYAGVDIFFVISGFVVTASLAHVRFESFGKLLVTFYARRLARIMPALIVCLLATMLLYTIFVPRSWLSSVNEQTGLAAIVGVSNLVLALNRDDYFAPTADYNPFLHTWSLGVEEQFYLIFPVLMFAYGLNRARRGRRRIALGVVIGAGVLSFALCGVLAAMRWEYSFYLMPARFWQLALGMVLALTYWTWQPRLAALKPAPAMGIVALSLLLLATSFATPSGPSFPFPLALIPTIATALVIVSVCARSNDLAGRALASAPMLYVGRRSYSLYLWHWPVFVLMRWTVGLGSPAQQLLALALAFMLGEFSYRWIEQPLRRPPPSIGRGWVVTAGLGAACLALLLSYGTVRFGPKFALAKANRTDIWSASKTSPLLSVAGCSLDGATRALAGGSVDRWQRKGCPQTSGRLFAIGNSHALAYAPMLRQFALDTGHPATLYFKSGCGYALLNRPVATVEACRDYIRQATNELAATLRPGDVLFLPSMRMPTAVNQWGGKAKLEADAVPAAMQEARVMLTRLAATGAWIVFEGPKPVMDVPVYRCVDWYTRTNPLCAPGLSVDRERLDRVRMPLLERMRSLQSLSPAIRIWDPFDRLCAGAQCQALDRGQPIYFDMHHLSNHANRMLRVPFREAILPMIGHPFSPK